MAPMTARPWPRALPAKPPLPALPVSALLSLLLGLCSGLLLALWSPASAAFSVGFINPGRSDEAYWVTAGQALQAAADGLGVTLEQHMAERDPLRVLQIARELAARPRGQRPDYVIVTNDRRTLVQAAQVLSAAGIKTFAAFSGLQEDERARFGPPRRVIPQLIGALEPNAEEAGYLTAKALIAQGLSDPGRLGPDGRLHLLAMAGDKSTPVSVYRNQGLLRAVREASQQVVLDQLVYADWRRDKAAEQAEWLLARHPQAQLVWAGSDQMAFGAMDALRKRGGQPGRELLFSAINTSAEAMQAVIDGRLAALAGGHFMAGAWSLVMLYDLHHGHDFIDEGTELDRPMFMLFGKAEAERYLQRFGAGIGPAGGPRAGIDFKPYSKVLNPRLKRYDFRFSAVLQ
jgi:ABC-type sugar transport system substrate-binding protein